MNTEIYKNKDGDIVLKTNDPYVPSLLESEYRNWEYITWKKEWGLVTKKVKIYKGRKKTDGYGNYYYIIHRGWAAYLLGALKDRVSPEDFHELKMNTLLVPNYRTAPFKELRDYQNEDVLYLLKYRVGLMTVNTGYGKTQVIATLTNYAHKTLKKNVLLVCPSNKARDELVKRCKNAFGLDVEVDSKRQTGLLDCMITTGLTNSKRSKTQEFLDLLAKYDWVLVDEVEYTINPGGELIYENVKQAEVFYGFSGTADKSGGRVITFKDGLSSEVVAENKDLIKFFGPSLIHRLPLERDINNIIVRTNALDNLTIPEDKNSNIYMELMNTIWTTPAVCEIIVKLIKRYPMMFIPINNLVGIINKWIEDYWKYKFRILLICGRGYVYYDTDGSETLLTLDEVCDYAREGKIDVMPSTSSGFRALDVPGLENILLVSGKVAGVVLQSIGRVARSKNMNIISLDSRGKKIPILTKSTEDRTTKMKEYYKYCNITDIDIEDYNL